MFKSFNGKGRIRKQVLSHIEERLSRAEDQYEEHCEIVDQQYQEDVARLAEGSRAAKESKISALVNWILNIS